MLSDKLLQKFQDLYFEEFGVRISKDEAREKGERLIRLVAITCGAPAPRKTK